MDMVLVLLSLGLALLFILLGYHIGISRVANHLSTPVMIVDNHGAVLWHNQACQSLKSIMCSQKVCAKLILFLQGVRKQRVFELELPNLDNDSHFSIQGHRIWYMGKQCWLLEYHQNHNAQSMRENSTDNKALLHNIIQSIPDAIGMMNEELVYEACNLSFVQALGIDSPDKLLGKTLAQVASKEIADKFAYSDLNVLETGKAFHIIDEIQSKTGTKQWMEARKFAFTDPRTQNRGLFIVARDITETILAKEKLQQAKEEFKRLSLIDGLTSVGNRRYFDESLAQIWSRHIESNHSLSIMFCDIDEFKTLNDTYGHSEGDRALIAVANALEKTVENTQHSVFRIGGEEFAFILSETTETEATQFAEGVHQKIELLNFPHSVSTIKPMLTISIGLHTLVPTREDSILNALGEVDKALYRAKANGKDQTVHAAA